MEEMRAAALAYYENFPSEKKAAALEFFQALDTDGSGTVSLQEFLDFLNGIGCARYLQSNSLYKELDSNGDGVLNFEEVVTFFYMFWGKRFVWCDGCGIFMKGLYFTCVACFEQADSDNTYDLCCNCYRNKNYDATQHTTFVDNYTLLRLKKPSPESDQAVVTTSRSVNSYRSGSKREQAKELLEAFEAGWNIGGAVYTIGTLAGCSIM